jgi:hypothetical protein
VLIDYKRILAYAGIEALVYQLLLVIHQTMLYATIDRHIYGVVGTVFSLVYLGATIINIGFDQALAAQFQTARQNRLAFKQLVGYQAGCNLLLAVLLLFPLYYCMATLYQLPYNSTQLVIIMLCIIIETYKKSSKNIMYLMLRHRFIALSELMHIVSYVAAVWLSLYAGIQPSLTLFFVPLIIISAVQTGLHGVIIMRYYYQLPDADDCSIDWFSVARERCAHYLYQLSHTIYSANLLVPLFATTFGMELAGLLKFASMIAYSINSIIRHTFGAACTGIFSALQRASLADKQQAFASVDSYLITTGITILSCLSMLCGIAYVCNAYAFLPIITVGAFLLLIFSEHLIITHEQFMVLEGKAWHLFICNGIALMPLVLLYTTFTTSVLELLVALIAAKYVSYGLIVYYTQSSWQLKLRLPKPLKCGKI